LRAKEIEAVRADCVHKSVTATGQDHHAIGVVLVDHVEQMDELLVRVAVENQLAAISVKGDFEHAIGLAAGAGARERFAISVELDHWGLPIDGNATLSNARAADLSPINHGPTAQAAVAEYPRLPHHPLRGVSNKQDPCATSAAHPAITLSVSERFEPCH
jgi:hypothetical protein